MTNIPRWKRLIIAIVIALLPKLLGPMFGYTELEIGEIQIIAAIVAVIFYFFAGPKVSRYESEKLRDKIVGKKGRD